MHQWLRNYLTKYARILFLWFLWIQLTLNISNSQGDEEIVRDIESSRYRIVDISSVNCTHYNASNKRTGYLNLLDVFKGAFNLGRLLYKNSEIMIDLCFWKWIYIYNNNIYIYIYFQLRNGNACRCWLDVIRLYEILNCFSDHHSFNLI